MDIGTVATTNVKGQLVIPKALREELMITDKTPLHITRMDGGILIQPVAEVVSKSEKEKMRAQGFNPRNFVGSAKVKIEEKTNAVEVIRDYYRHFGEE